MAINPSSLLGRSQTTNPQPQTSPVSSIIPNRNVPNVTPPEREDSPEGGKTILDQLVQIKDKVLSIQKIITKNEKLFQKMEENNRKQEENERRKNKELKLEEKKEDLPIKDLENKEFPKIGLLDKIKRFIFYTLVGSAFVKFGKHLPKILQFTKYLIPAFDFFEKFTVNLLNGVTDFIGAGYKAYDKVKELTVNLVGDKTEEQLKEFDAQFNKFANLALIVGMSTLGGTDFGLGGGNKERLGVDKKTGQRVSKRSQARFLNRYGEKAYIERFGKRSFKGLTGKTAGRFASKAFGKIPIIGGLVDFIISTVIFKENPGRAAAKAVGATIGSTLGTLLPFPFAGTLLGGYLGDLVGGTLYDSIVGGDPPKAKARGGQVTRGNKKVGGAIKRTIKKTRKRPAKTLPQKTIPGKDVGGRKQIEKIFSPAAIKVLETTSDNVKKVPLLNGIMGVSVDLTMGQKPDRKTYKQIRDGFGYLIQNAMDAEVASSMSDIRSQLVGLAGGGVVPRTLRSDENIGMKIGERLAKTFEIMVNSEVSNTLQAIRRQLGTDTSGGGGTPGGGTPGGGGGGILPGDAPPEVKAALEAIAGAEGGWDSVNPGKVVPGLRNMTIAQAREVGMRQRAIEGTGALGKFQQIPVYNGVNVLKQRAEAAGLNYERDKFNEENQTKIARAYIAGIYPGGEAQLIKDAKKDPMILADKLKGVYPSLPGGSQPNVHTSGYLDRYKSSLEKYRTIKTGAITPDKIYPLDPSQGRDPGQPGIDFTYKGGKTLALYPGKVVDIGSQYRSDGGGYGNYVLIESVDPNNGKKFTSLYAHFGDNKIYVKKGDTVQSGQVIGAQPNRNIKGHFTGSGSGEHTSVDFYEPDGRTRYSGSNKLITQILDSFAGKNQYPTQTQPDKPSVTRQPSPPPPVRTGRTRKSWNPERDSGLKRNEKGEWVKASLAPSEPKALASGIDTEAPYEKTGGINVTTIARQAMIIREEVQVASSRFSPTLNNYGTTNKNLSSVIG